MKFLCFIATLVSICSQLNAQNTEFVFDKELNKLIALKEGGSPYVFEVLSKEYTTAIKKPETKRVSKFYKKALAFANKAKNDSVKIAELKKESNYTPNKVKELNAEEINNRLRTASRILKNTKKYELVSSKIVLQKQEDLKMRRSIFKPQNIIIGKFKYLGSYYVAKGFDGYSERSLISVTDAQKNKLTKEHFLLDTVFQLIQNVKTKVLYIVYTDFLEKYPINMVASQNKYKGKITLSASYVNEIDKNLDAIIIEYNRSLLKIM
ncbi:hypothetical protein E1J38_009100 [Seonamhaeicola sediminis]|uniref:Uncharacterized protein n=1 Tax=Seonamhaeicola sediminis TaxID=2528206 RepID=A0A562YFB6_9FLAO|nr:hypothetical protein [Seonamhaeicola sediminis]TWO33006.1 hypothetical protein E1J38_009100 [Seonamhaeicola sediminis]